MYKLDSKKAEAHKITLLISNRQWKELRYRQEIDNCYMDYAKAFDCVDHNKLRVALNKIRLPRPFLLLSA